MTQAQRHKHFMAFYLNFFIIYIFFLHITKSFNLSSSPLAMLNLADLRLDWKVVIHSQLKCSYIASQPNLFQTRLEHVKCANKDEPPGRKKDNKLMLSNIYTDYMCPKFYLSTSENIFFTILMIGWMCICNFSILFFLSCWKMQPLCIFRLQFAREGRDGYWARVSRNICQATTLLEYYIRPKQLLSNLLNVIKL